jgi:hypothetical protein
MFPTRAALILLATLSSAGAAFAQVGPGAADAPGGQQAPSGNAGNHAMAAALAPQMSAARAACMGDYEQLCATVKPGNGRALACLRQHQDQLSSGCKQSLQAVQEAAKQYRATHPQG